MSFVRPNQLLTLAVNKYVIARKPFAAEYNIIVYIGNDYRGIKDPIALNVKSTKKHFLYFVALFSIITIKL